MTKLLRTAIAGLFFFLPSARAQTSELDRFVGVDFWNPRLPEKELMRLYDLSGIDPLEMCVETMLDPWHMWKTGVSGSTRYIFLLGGPMLIIPGRSSACIRLFDSSAKLLGSWTFQTGWRIQLVSATSEYSKVLSGNVIVLHMAPVINGRNVAKEFFALANDQLRLVRIENNEGESIHNECVLPDYGIGLVPQAKDLNEWLAILESKSLPDVMSALLFLGGQHVDGTAQTLKLQGDAIQRMLGDRRLGAVIERLSESPNEWVRQAAALAARRGREPFYR
jgi:hypothetical protein